MNARFEVPKSPPMHLHARVGKLRLGDADFAATVDHLLCNFFVATVGRQIEIIPEPLIRKTVDKSVNWSLSLALRFPKMGMSDDVSKFLRYCYRRIRQSLLSEWKLRWSLKNPPLNLQLRLAGLKFHDADFAINVIEIFRQQILLEVNKRFEIVSESCIQETIERTVCSFVRVARSLPKLGVQKAPSLFLPCCYRRIWRILLSEARRKWLMDIKESREQRHCGTV